MRYPKLRRRRRGAEKAKRLPPRETNVIRSLRLPQSVDAALIARAARDGRSINNMIVTLLTEALATELAALATEESQRWDSIDSRDLADDQ
jgi:hypothetical protein